VPPRFPTVITATKPVFDGDYYTIQARTSATNIALLAPTGSPWELAADCVLGGLHHGAVPCRRASVTPLYILYK
jgi:hypothetical protein